MVEQRALISDIEQTRQKLTDLGAVFDSDYAFKDIIFVPKKANYNLNDDVVRARVYIKNNWPTKKVVLMRKQTQFKELGKIDNVILKKEFDTIQEALDFISAELGTEFEYGFEYEREGWQYNLSDSHIFVEDIKDYKPSIEIEANSVDEMDSLFANIDIVERIRDSLPETMRKVLKPTHENN